MVHYGSLAPSVQHVVSSYWKKVTAKTQAHSISLTFLSLYVGHSLSSYVYDYKVRKWHDMKHPQSLLSYLNVYRLFSERNVMGTRAYVKAKV